MLKLRKFWSEHKEDTLLVVLLVILFVLLSYLLLQNFVEPASAFPPHRPSSIRSWLF
jgi:hypothetical protein